MPKYIVDEKANDMIRLAAGLYKYGDEVDGFIEQSLYWASITFEYIIRSTAGAVIGKKETSQELEYIIRAICASRPRDYPQGSLLQKKRIRNSMFHPEGSITVPHVKDMLDTVCRMAGHDYQELVQEVTYEQLRKLRDNIFKIPRSGLPLTVTHQQPIFCSDFDDLDVLYEKCRYLHFASLKNSLVSLGLEPEEMSELIPTSGTIWLPWVLHKAGNRSHVRSIVLGLNLSPTFVRIGIDFGSYAYAAKERYYTLLLSGSLDPQLAGLPDDYFFIDTFWYFNVGKRLHVREYWPSRITEIKPEIEKALAETRCKRESQTQMKGHYFLIGKTFQRGSDEFSDILKNLSVTVHNVFSDLLQIMKRVESEPRLL